MKKLFTLTMLLGALLLTSKSYALQGSDEDKVQVLQASVAQSAAETTEGESDDVSFHQVIKDKIHRR